MKRVKFLNGDFDPLTLDQCVASLLDAIHEGRREWLCTVNVAILMMMRKNPKLQCFVDQAGWVVADGQPLVWAAPIFHGRLPERVTGIDLIDRLARESERKGLRIYLLGSKQHVLEKVAKRLAQRYPGVNICGMADGYFSEADMASRAEAVRDSGAHILLVAMGVPRQEQFIEAQWARLGVNVAIGVGGSFDVIAGLRKRAPRLLQRIGMEWFFRLMQEPQRMWYRYLTTNTLFVLLVGKAIISRGISMRRGGIEHE